RMDAAYKKVVADGKAKCRITQQSCFNTLVGFKEYLEAGFRMGNGNSPYRIGPLKLFVDGSLGARTALMRKPYADDPSTVGIECMSQETLNEFVRIATEHKMQVITHAIGDKAIEMVLNAIEKEGGEGNALRHGVVHAQITDKPMLERFKKLNALCFAQPIFLHYDMHVVADRVGEELANTSYNFKTLYDSGVHTSFGTDSPVEDLKTFDNIHCAVNRRDLKHFPEGGWVPSECFTVKEAIDCYTKEGAYASFEEYEKGTLEDGKFADFVVLDRNIFEIPKADLINTKVLMTVMGGEVTYKA
ncbi:MAG: amidohydrolase family protein, partial [Clostridia bacterium]|nr:amidohydrolase family protein [Clostridia bacterium]